MAEQATRDQLQQMPGQVAARQAHLQQLVQLKESGKLTEEEFAAAKAKLFAV
jgi:hypothetical protein